jgi:lauroyl/myristoyl acyltransferase
MNPISLATSRWGPFLVMLLCRVLPRRLIYRLGDWISTHIARRRDRPFVKALHANVAVVHGLPEEHSKVARAVARLLRNTVRGYVDLFRALLAGPKKIRTICELDPSLISIIEMCLGSGQGLVLVGAHTCSFDLLLLRINELFPSVQVLSNSAPKGSSQVMNDLRRKHGLDTTPISVHSLRQAVNRLRVGGVVAIAADLPIENGEESNFFGQKSRLPVGHTRLALGTHAKILVGFSHRIGEGLYRAEAVLVPRPVSVGDKRRDVVRWAQDSLTAVEGFIQRWPEEWLMPLPVWPKVASPRRTSPARQEPPTKFVDLSYHRTNREGPVDQPSVG